MKHIKAERGIALIVAVVGLVVMGTLIAALVAVSVLEYQQAANMRRMGQAFAAAEHGLGEAVGNWDAGSWNMLATGASVDVAGSTPNALGTYSGAVRRLNSELFLVNVIGIDAATRARQHVAAFVKLKTVNMNIDAALTTRGPTRVGGSAEIDGADQPPPGWTGCALDAPLAGVLIADPSDLETQGACSGASCIDGNPPVAGDPTIDDSTFFQYGDLDWNALTAMATKVLPPGTYAGVSPSFAGGECNTADPRNWGDPFTPTSACGGYFPIIYSPGDLNINGDYGQGILLVEGDLAVQGGFQFFGVVVVREKLRTPGTGGHFNGAVLVANVDLDQNTVLGNSLVQYSSCAATRALNAATNGALLRSRSWIYAY